MKAPEFDYVKPRLLAEIFPLLQEYGDEARLLAGGQTLLATLNMRLSEPSVLIDLSAIAELRGIALSGSTLRIGAMVTHSEIEASALVAEHAPLLPLAAPHIAHRAIRNLGTLGGSIAYADPAAEWPTCLLALDGAVVTKSAAGERRIRADDFFVDLYTTTLLPGEIIVACEFPVASAGHWCDFDELARRHGDYAIVGLAGVGQRSQNTLTQVRLVFLGLGATPLRASRAEAVINGQPLTEALIDQAVVALKDEFSAVGDLTSDAATKMHLSGVLLKRMLMKQMQLKNA